jgi:hypothetical protein
MGDQSVARPLPARRITQTQNKRTQTSMLKVGFEPTIPASERAKTVHALDRTATVIGWHDLWVPFCLCLKYGKLSSLLSFTKLQT